MLAALAPVVPMPSHAARSSAREPAGLLALRAEFPSGPVAGFAGEFRWSGPAGPASLVVLAADYSPIARFDGIEGARMQLPPDVLERCRNEPVVHWRVEVRAVDGTLYSPLAQARIR